MAIQTLDAFIFIDTNIFLDFYRNRKSDVSLKYLELINNHKDRIIVTSQVEMEFKKNRQIVLLDSIGKLKVVDGNDLTIPTILSHMQASKNIIKNKNKISQDQAKLKAKFEAIFKNPSYNDPVYIALQKLWKTKSDINLNRTNPKRVEIRELASKRFSLGYPPRKDKDTSFGDAINWEWIIECARIKDKHIIIVSRDSDYGFTYSNELYLNDWLAQEFKQRVKKGKKIILTDKLGVAFKSISVQVPKAVIEDENTFLNTNVLSMPGYSYPFSTGIFGTSSIYNSLFGINTLNSPFGFLSNIYSPPQIKVPEFPQIKVPDFSQIKIPDPPQVKVPEFPQIKVPEPKIKIPRPPRGNNSNISKAEDESDEK